MAEAGSQCSLQGTGWSQAEGLSCCVTLLWPMLPHCCPASYQVQMAGKSLPCSPAEREGCPLSFLAPLTDLVASEGHQAAGGCTATQLQVLDSWSQSSSQSLPLLTFFL